jgi:hypothetical protein
MRAACLQISRSASVALLKSKSAFPRAPIFYNVRTTWAAYPIQFSNLKLQRSAFTWAERKGKEDIFSKYPAEASEEHFNLLLNGIKTGVPPRRSVVYRY